MNETVIILDGRKFDWTDIEIAQFRTYWDAYRQHSSNTIEIVKQIAADMEEDPDDVLLLALDQSRKRKIT